MDSLLQAADTEHTVPASAKKTLHIRADDVPWVIQPGGTVDEGYQPAVATRVLHSRPRDSFIVAQIRAEPGATTALHRHKAPAMGFTEQGAWGHDHNFSYRPGVYLFETPGVLHRFINGPETSVVTFLHTGDIEFVDVESRETTAILALDDIVRGYFEACEEAGFDRPNILQ